MGRSEDQYLTDEEYEGDTPPTKGKKRVHRWNEADTRVLPHAIQKALNNLGIPMPWEEVALQMKNGQTGGAIAQHMAKDCASLKENGVKVPSPLKRGGKRTSHNEPLPILAKRQKPLSSNSPTPSRPLLPKPLPNSTPAPAKSATTVLNKRVQQEFDSRERKLFRKNPSKYQPRDTPHPGPRQNGQYTLKCAPVPGMPAFAQRQMRPYPPPFFKPPAPAVNRPAPSPPAVREVASPLPAQEELNVSASEPVQETVDLSVPEPVPEIIDLSGPEQVEEAINLSASEQMQQAAGVSMSEPEHESSMAQFDPEPEFYLDEPEPENELEFSMEGYLGQDLFTNQSISWAPSWSPGNQFNFMPHTTPVNHNNLVGGTIDPSVFIKPTYDAGW